MESLISYYGRGRFVAGGQQFLESSDAPVHMYIYNGLVLVCSNSPPLHQILGSRNWSIRLRHGDMHNEKKCGDMHNEKKKKKCGDMHMIAILSNYNTANMRRMVHIFRSAFIAHLNDEKARLSILYSCSITDGGKKSCSIAACL